MDWITDAVAIGTRSEAQDAARLRAGGIRSVLSLDGAFTGDEAAGLGLAEIVSVPLRDGSSNDARVFRRAVEALTRLAASQAPVLVQCQYGRSRSPAVVAGYLMGIRGLDPLQARELVAAKRDISISAALVPLLFQL
jgi:protein-tyrosine phosphatase